MNRVKGFSGLIFDKRGIQLTLVTRSWRTVADGWLAARLAQVGSWFAREKVCRNSLVRL